MLYGEPALLKRADGADFAYACGYARAVSANVSGISRELAQAWSAEGDFGRQFAAPRPANDLYRNSQEVAAEAVKALSTGLQFARDVKILPVLGDAPEAARPKRAAYWRSNLSSRTLASSLDAMLAFHRAGAYPLPQGGSWIDEAVRGDCRAPRRPCATRRRPTRTWPATARRAANGRWPG